MGKTVSKGKAVGLIGIGSAGSAMLNALCKNFQVIAHDRSSERRQFVEERQCAWAESPIELARQSDVILLSLPTPRASRDVIESLLDGLEPGKLIIETSTVSPEDVLVIHELCTARGASVIDCAVIGGVAKLNQGQTTFLVGASSADFERASPILNTMAEEVFYLGEPGSGMRAKLVNNAVAHALMVLLVESAALARSVNVPMEVFFRLMDRESGLLRPLRHRFRDRILAGNYTGGMSTSNARKDSQLILELAQEKNVPLFVLPAAHTVYEIGLRKGLGAEDYASIASLWEEWLNLSFSDG